MPTGQSALLSVLGETQPIPQTLYADEAAYGSFLIAAAPTSVSHTSLPANIQVSVTLSGGPDNYFHVGDSDGPGFADESVHQLNVTLACVTSTGLGCSLGTTSVSLTAAQCPANPCNTASTTLTITGTVAGTVYVQASEAGYPSVTVKVTVT